MSNVPDRFFVVLFGIANYFLYPIDNERDRPKTQWRACSQGRRWWWGNKRTAAWTQDPPTSNCILLKKIAFVILDCVFLCLTCVSFHIAVAAWVVLNVEPVFNPLREMSQNNIRNNYKPWQIQIVWQLQRVVGVPLVADVIRGVTVWKCFYQIDDFNHFVSIVIIVFIDAG